MSSKPAADTPPSLAVFSHGELMGDAMIKLPFIRALRGAFPGWRIVWIGTETSELEKTVKPVIPDIVDEFVCGHGWGETPWDFLKAPPVREKFPLVIDTQGLFWRSLLARKIRHKVFVSSCGGYAISDKKPAPERRKLRHGLERLLSLIEAATGVPQTVPPLRLGLTPPPQAMEEARALLPAGPSYVALAPGAGKRHKCWPLENFVALARIQVAKGRVPVFLLGPGEVDWLPELRAAVPDARFPLQADGIAEPRYTPIRTIAVARECAAAVGADCGLTHILGVADIPLVSLFGPTSGAKVHPKVAHGRWLQAQDFGPERAMSQIPVAAVADAVDAVMAEAAGSLTPPA